MIAEILSVGTELLMGQIANTDAQYISRRLSELGVTLYRHTTVGDNPARVKEALGQALDRADMVITTGGLGPTEDDLTKEMVGEYFGLKMALHRPSLEAIESYMRRIGRPMTENNVKQAYFPEGAIVMPNLCGTAPGCIVERGGKAVAVLPGPPRELKDMFERQLAQYLARRSGAHIESRFLRVFGVGESLLETMLIDLFHSDNPTLALYCGAGEVQARISARAETVEQARARIAPLEAEIRRRVGDAVYGVGADNSMSQVVLEQLRARGETVCFAESCTGGMIASALVDHAGASDALSESYVTYSNEAKERLLGVRGETLRKFGAVSAECAVEMAEGARRASGATWGVSATGIAGPDGGTDEKPVGTVFVGVAGARRRARAGIPLPRRPRVGAHAHLRQRAQPAQAAHDPRRRRPPPEQAPAAETAGKAAEAERIAVCLQEAAARRERPGPSARWANCLGKRGGRKLAAREVCSWKSCAESAARAPRRRRCCSPRCSSRRRRTRGSAAVTRARLRRKSSPRSRRRSGDGLRRWRFPGDARLRRERGSAARPAGKLA